MIKNALSLKLLLLLSLATIALGKPRIGQSAIQTYVFPWGSRSAGMAETFTGVADNVEALFYNPAGLGQTPLTKTWIHSFNSDVDTLSFIEVSAKRDRSISDKENVWALREDGTIFSYNGATWIDYSIHLLDSTETLKSIAESKLIVEDYSIIDSAIILLKEFNGIGVKAENEIRTLLNEKADDGVNVDSLAGLLSVLPASEKNETDILGYIFESVPANESSDIAYSISQIVDKPDEFTEMLEIKIPFNIGPSGDLNTITVDPSGRLWVGSNNGLWRFDGIWKHFVGNSGLPSDTILSIFAINQTSMLIGTKNGITRFDNGIFTQLGSEETATSIIQLAGSSIDAIYAATNNGVFKISSDTIVTRISPTGAEFDSISAVMVDSRNRLWIGSGSTVAIYDGQLWKTYELTGSYITGFAEDNPNHFWISTNISAVEFIEHEDQSPEYKFHHERNGLPSSDITSVIQFGRDTWLSTSKGISQFKSGEVQVTMFFEQLLPKLDIDDIWHTALAGVIPLGENGTFGIQANYLYFGEVPEYNQHGVKKPSKSSYEFVGGLSYGLPIKPDFSLGMSLKYGYSRLTDDAQAHSIAVDAALLRTNLFTEDLSLGFMMMNIGPPVFYDSERTADPIPFTLRYGMSYKPIMTPSAQLLVAFDLDREMVYFEDNGEPMPFYKAVYYDLFNDTFESNNDELQKIIFHGGLEFMYARSLSARVGYMHDEAGKRKEMTFGVGLETSVVTFDFGMILTVGENDVRNNQVRFSLTHAR